MVDDPSTGDVAPDAEPSIEALRAGLDALDDLFFVLGPDGGFRYSNSAVVKATGLADDALATTTLDALVADEDVERVRAAVAAAVDEGSATVEATLVAADGERVPHEFRLAAAPDGVDRQFVGVGHDVSARRRAEERRRAILDRMTNAFFAVNERWELTYVNERARGVLLAAMDRVDDPSTGELEGLRLWEEIPEAEGTEFYDRYHEALATQESVAFESYYPPLDTWFEVHVYPSASGLSIYFDDVTERRRQRDALERRDRVLRETYDVIADADRSLDEQVHSLLEIARAEVGTSYGVLSRIEADEFTVEVSDVAPGADVERGALAAGDTFPLSATTCEATASVERTLVLADAERDAPGEVAGLVDNVLDQPCYLGAPVFVDGEVYGTLCLYDDEPREGGFSDWHVTLLDLMSRWVSYELERERDHERLRQQNERLDQFASIVSHDLRSPLNVVQGSLDLAAATGDEEHFERARTGVRRMETLIDDLLALAQAGDDLDERTPVALGALVERCWETVSTGNATLRVETDAVVEADGTRLRQAIENLVRNAVEHGGDGVTVTVGDLPDGGFYVADDGPGIPADDRDMVFEGGYTTATDGTGMGLAIVETIARAHGWNVDLAAGADGGARFEFRGVSVVERSEA